MYSINSTINTVDFDGLNASKLIDIDAKEILFICLEKDKLFPKHTSPRDVHIVVLEGEITFHINNTTYCLKQHDVFDFPKNEEHWVEAVQNSKFLVIR